MKSATFIEVTRIAIVIIFVYTAASKLLDFANYEAVLSKSILFKQHYKLIAWTLPIVEIIVAFIIAYRKTQAIGLWASVILLLSFTAYITIMLFTQGKNLPCSCGGVIGKLSWKGHIVLNLTLAGAAITSILFIRKRISIGQ